MSNSSSVIRSLARILVVVILGAVSTGCSSLRKADDIPRDRFDGLSSEEALMDEFVAAVAANDRATLDRLRVTEWEYRNVIIPGTAPVGKTMQGPISDKKFNFFWGMLNGKSRDYATVILHEYGGKPWRRTRHWYAGEKTQYSGYRAFNETRIAVVDDQGNTATIRSGPVADVDGRYKFIGFQYDGD